MKQKVIFLSLVSVLLGGCVTAKLQSPPPELTNKATYSIARSSLLDETNHTVMHVDESKNILYHQTFGGSAGVGLLLGPFGIAANMAAIEANTEADVKEMRGKIKFNPIDIFSKAAQKYKYELSTDDLNSMLLSPYVYISKLEDESLVFAAALLVTKKSEVGNNWVGKYIYQLPLTMKISNFSDGLSQEEFSLLNSGLEKGFDELAQIYAGESNAKLDLEPTITFVSSFVNPMYEAELIGSLVSSRNDRFNIRTVGAIYSLPKGFVKVKMPPKPKA